MMRIWLDDVREAPPGWTRTTTVQQTIYYLRSGQVAEVSLDYDLDFTDGRHKGTEVLEYIMTKMLKDPTWRRPVIHVHTANPYGGQKMAHLWRTIEATEQS